MAEAVPAPARERLLDAAELRFRRFGYRRASVDAITEDADVGKGSLYLHFPSKAELYLAVVERSLTRFADDAAAAMSEAGSAPERLSALVATAAAHYERDDLLTPSMLGRSDLVAGRVARLAAELQRERIAGLIAIALHQGQQEGTIRSTLEPERAATILFEIGWAVVRRHLEGRSTGPLADDLNTLNDLVGWGTMARRSTTT